MTEKDGVSGVGELKAGRELDCIVAEKVFGLVRCENLHHDGHFPNTYCYAQPDSVTKGAEVEAFSTDISAAWEVVSEVQKRHLGWRFSLLGGDKSFGYFVVEGGGYVCDRSERQLFGWHARFFGDEDPTTDTGSTHGESAFEETPALAICLAALKAVEHTPEPSVVPVESSSFGEPK